MTDAGQPGVIMKVTSYQLTESETELFKRYFKYSMAFWHNVRRKYKPLDDYSNLYLEELIISIKTFSLDYNVQFKTHLVWHLRRTLHYILKLEQQNVPYKPIRESIKGRNYKRIYSKRTTLDNVEMSKLECPNEYESIDNQDTLENILKILNVREQEIIHMYFWEYKTHKEIADRYQFSKNNTQRIINRALEKMRLAV